MRYDKFRGESIPEILMQIRKKYGTNVYILETKEIKQGGLLGTNLLSKKLYEIQVMIPEDNAPYKPRDFLYSNQTKKIIEPQPPKKRLEIEQEKIIKKQESINSTKPSLESKPSLETDLSDIDYLIRSLQQLKNEKLLELDEPTNVKEEIKENQEIKEKSLDEGKTTNYLKLEKPTKEEIHALLNFDSERSDDKKLIYNELEDKEKLFVKIRDKLIKSEFSEEFTQKFFQVLKKKLPSVEERNPKDLHRFIIKELSNFVYYDPELKPIPNKTKVIFFVGPNASGKTTSLAKVSAKIKIDNKYNISIISLDDYRLAATEQLKTYCNILNIPFYAPVKMDEYFECLIRDNADFVFVDTPGLSLKDQERLQKIKKFIEKTESKEVHLVLSAIMRYDIIEKYISFFGALNFDKIILTGLDEVKFSGFFIELADKIKRPFSFFMNGQDVPDDILEVEMEELVENLLI